MKLNHTQLEENYQKYKNYYDTMFPENFFDTEKRHVVINSPSTYVRNHELAHAIQMKNGSIFILAHLAIKLHRPRLKRLQKFADWLQTYATFYMEWEACKMAIRMTKYVNKWNIDEATIAHNALRSYAKTPFQLKLVNKQDFN